LTPGNLAVYKALVIRSFTSRALRALWERDDRARIDVRLVDRILRRLDALDAALRPEDMDQPGFDFHRLRGARRGTYSVHVNGPWCITFDWAGTDAVRVALEQYH
jgi:proteic killer suppression protein